MGAVLAASTLAASPALAIVGLIAASLILGWRHRRRVTGHQRAEGHAMAGALELLIGELRVGAHPARALAVAAAESPGMVGKSLRGIAIRSGLGADVVAGLRMLAGESSIPARWVHLAACWNLAAENGLAISTLIRAAHREMVERQRFGDRIDAALAGARATAIILAVLPVVGVALGESVGAHPIRFLLGDGIGGVLLVAGATFIAIGLAWAGHIIDGVR